MDSQIIIKQIPNRDNPELGIKYVGAKEYATPKVGRDGKVVTGIDEFSYEINRLPADEAKKIKTKIEKLRANLEKMLGQQDLTPSSPFWNEFYVVLEDEKHLDPTNAMDILIEHFLVANRYVAPSLDAISDDENFHNCLFYIYREEEEITKKAANSKKKDSAIAKLVNLNEENPNRLKIIAAHIFSFDSSSDVSADAAYVKIKEFLDDEEHEKKNIETFLEAYKKTPEEMRTKQIFDTAVRKKVITKKAGVYRRGEVEYGKEYEECLEFLASPENSGEVAFLSKTLSK